MRRQGARVLARGAAWQRSGSCWKLRSRTASSFVPMFPMEADATEFRRLEPAAPGRVWLERTRVGDKSTEFLAVHPHVLRDLSATAFRDIAHLLRPSHLAQLAAILRDDEASSNDKFVALELLKNANIASAMVLPGCQDTGTAIVMAKRGAHVLTIPAESENADGAMADTHQFCSRDESWLAQGVEQTYTSTNLRYSQLAPLDMFREKNTGTNLPAQIEIAAVGGRDYHFLFMAKGGGSANKSFLYQQTKALLNSKASLLGFLREKLKSLGTAACPPYHLAIVVGGLSAEMTLKTVKLASARYYDGLLRAGSEGGHALRDVELEADVLALTREMGIGAQFGGKYFCHDVRVLRLPRHGASCPVGIGVSCSADRQALAKITADGVFLERLETNVGKYLPDVTENHLSSGSGDSTPIVAIDLNQPMDKIRATLSRYPIRTRLSLSGTLVVARDIAHAKIVERLERGEPLPQYLRDHIVYYAGPAKTPAGYASGSFGPTTAGRMDAYVERLMAAGGSFVSLAKGNRSRVVTRACQKHGGFYLGSIGGPAAALAQECIRAVEVLEYAELGMEAVWRIRVENFPAFIVVDDKGNDFFAEWRAD